jgi:hypothetical protein
MTKVTRVKCTNPKLAAFGAYGCYGTVVGSAGSLGQIEPVRPGVIFDVDWLDWPDQPPSEIDGGSLALVSEAAFQAEVAERRLDKNDDHPNNPQGDTMTNPTTPFQHSRQTFTHEGVLADFGSVMLCLNTSDVETTFGDAEMMATITVSSDHDETDVDLRVIVDSSQLRDEFEGLQEVDYEAGAQELIAALDSIACEWLGQSPSGETTLQRIENRRLAMHRMLLMYLQKEYTGAKPDMNWAHFFGEAMASRVSSEYEIATLKRELVEAKAARLEARIMAEEHEAKRSEMSEALDAAKNEAAWEKVCKEEQETLVHALREDLLTQQARELQLRECIEWSTTKLKELQTRLARWTK